MTTPRTSWVEVATIVAFLAAISAPLLLAGVLPSPAEEIFARERRVPAPLPDAPVDLESWERFPRETTSWYADRFGLRMELTRAFHAMQLHVLGGSPADNVVLGKDGWLFGDDFQSGASTRGADPFTPDELDAWVASIRDKRDWLAAQGIEYALVVVPAKETVYPEHVDDALAPVGPSRREQLLAALAETPRVRTVDVLPGLLAEKRRDRPESHVYFPLGLHWSGRGAYVGYRMILDALPARFHVRRPFRRDELDRVPLTGPGDDYSHNFLTANSYRQSEFRWRPAEGQRAARTLGARADGSCGFPEWASPDGRGPRALIIRDSFGSQVLPLLACHFGRLTDCPSLKFSPEFVRASDPELVIELWFEHTLSFEAPHRIARFEQDELATAFADLPDRALHVAGAAGADALRPDPGTRIDADADGARVSAAGAPVVRLPERAVPRDAYAILRLELTAPATTVASVFYPLTADGKYRRKQSSQLPVRAGRQTLYLELPPRQVEGPLAFSPGCASGDYVIHRVEIRAAGE